MHKLGNELTADDKKNEIRQILTARRKLYNAGTELLECDDIYAGNIKIGASKAHICKSYSSFCGCRSG